MRASLPRFAPALAVAILGLGLASPAHADDDKLAEARQHMQAGAAFYNDPSGHKCEEAVREFKKAYELSGSLNALRGAAICSLELERDGEAIATYEQYLTGKGDKIDPAEKKQMTADLTALKSAVAWITLRTDRPGVRIVDTRTPARGFPITNRYDGSVDGEKFGIHPGEHVFTASVSGEPDQVWRVSVVNGTTLEHSFVFDTSAPAVAAAEPPENGPVAGPEAPGAPMKDTSGSRPVPTSVYVVGGLTVALAVPTVVFMVLATGKKSDYDAANGHATKAELEDLRAGVTTMNLVSDIGMGVTAASLVATGILYFTRPTKSDGPKASAWAVAPIVGPSSAGALLTKPF
jgi:hypothetical protein